MVLIMSVWQLLFISADLPISSDIDSTLGGGGKERETNKGAATT